VFSKKHFLAVAAALVVGLVGAGGVLATDLPSPGSGPGLLPNLALQSDAWRKALTCSRPARRFFHGFRAAVHGHTLYDYGSLDGGVGAIWSARQAFFVPGGLRCTEALPEIYNSAMARERAELTQIVPAVGTNIAG
jgi:hypothetical protein